MRALAQLAQLEVSFGDFTRIGVSRINGLAVGEGRFAGVTRSSSSLGVVSARKIVGICAHDHEPRHIVQWGEQLAAERMTLHEPDDDRSWSCCTDEQAYVEVPAF